MYGSGVGHPVQQTVEDVPGLFAGVRVLGDIVKSFSQLAHAYIDIRFAFVTADSQMDGAARLLLTQPVVQAPGRFTVVPLYDDVAGSQSRCRREAVGIHAADAER